MLAKDSTTARLNDFGHWLSPVAVKELRQGLRANGFVMPFILAHLAAIIALIFEYQQAGLGRSGGTPSNLWDPGLSVWFVTSFVVLLVMPLMAVRGLANEVKEDNFELLLLAGLSRWRIALGKWATQFALSMLLLISLCPYLLLLYFFGGVDLWQTLAAIVGFAAANAAGVALMLGVSGFRNLLARTVVLLVAAFSLAAVGGPTVAGAMSKIGDAGSLAGMLASVLAMGAIGGLYAILGMQLVRAHLRAYENPIDPPPTGLIIGMLITLPLILGVLTVAVPVFGSLVGGAFFIVLALLIDPERVRMGG